MKLLPYLAALLPFTAIACVEPSTEDVAGSSDDITSIDDLGPLETNLGLTKDEDRIRPEALVKAGPCYQKMEASKRTWNMRRYTKGAAFFFTRADGEPLDPVACVDLDVTKQGQPATVALEGHSLDIAQRYQLGHPSSDQTLAGASLVFDRGTILRDDHLGVHYLSALSMSEKGPGLTIDQWVPEMSEAMAATSLLAYRYAKQDAGQPLAQDPVGRFVALTDPNGTSWVARFEKVEVEHERFDGEKPGVMLTLTSRADNATHAGCIRFDDTAAAGYACWIHPSEGKWEIPWGADFH